MSEQRRVSFNDVSLLLSTTFSSGAPNTAMDVTTTTLKMSSMTTQSLFSYVEEENLSALKAHLDKYRDVDTRSDVSVQKSMLSVQFMGIFGIMACARFSQRF